MPNKTLHSATSLLRRQEKLSKLDVDEDAAAQELARELNRLLDQRREREETTTLRNSDETDNAARRGTTDGSTSSSTSGAKLDYGDGTEKTASGAAVSSSNRHVDTRTSEVDDDTRQNEAKDYGGGRGLGGPRGVLASSTVDDPSLLASGDPELIALERELQSQMQKFCPALVGRAGPAPAASDTELDGDKSGSQQGAALSSASLSNSAQKDKNLHGVDFEHDETEQSLQINVNAPSNSWRTTSSSQDKTPSKTLRASLSNTATSLRDSTTSIGGLTGRTHQDHHTSTGGIKTPSSRSNSREPGSARGNIKHPQLSARGGREGGGAAIPQHYGTPTSSSRSATSSRRKSDQELHQDATIAALYRNTRNVEDLLRQTDTAFQQLPKIEADAVALEVDELAGLKLEMQFLESALNERDGGGTTTAEEEEEKANKRDEDHRGLDKRGDSSTSQGQGAAVLGGGASTSTTIGAAHSYNYVEDAATQLLQDELALLEKEWAVLKKREHALCAVAELELPSSESPAAVSGDVDHVKKAASSVGGRDFLSRTSKDEEVESTHQQQTASAARATTLRRQNEMLKAKFGITGLVSKQPGNYSSSSTSTDPSKDGAAGEVDFASSSDHGHRISRTGPLRRLDEDLARLDRVLE
ncbi:unnamed protein product [Amoebophrya sp. A120]|nr:unnamed protein product [Amoebophrya sp. A120]|eukprot:GSA120T00000640001.1